MPKMVYVVLIFVQFFVFFYGSQWTGFLMGKVEKNFASDASQSYFSEERPFVS